MKLEYAQTRMFSPENFTGAKGGGARATTGTGEHAARELGVGWKVSPSIFVQPGQTTTIADIAGPGVLKHFWMTAPNNRMRDLIIAIYWDDDESPSVEVPAADFFCDGWLERPYVNSTTIKLLPANGYNSYWRMPFRQRARMTLTNISGEEVVVYYSGTYDLRLVDPDEAYFNATWRRKKPLGDPADFTVVDGIRGSGAYVGTYIAIQPNAAGWWGEGEMKFYMDGDDRYPTICGTGTEDYVGGAWNFDVDHRYVTYTTDQLGLPQASPAGTIYKPYQRFGLYRWHLADPIRFYRDLRVTLQAIGAGSRENGDRFTPLVNADIAALSAWYQMPDRKRPQRRLAEQASEHGYESLSEYFRIDS